MNQTNETPNVQPEPQPFTPGISNAPVDMPQPAQEPAQPEPAPAAEQPQPAQGEQQPTQPQSSVEPAAPAQEEPKKDYDAYLDELIGKANSQPVEIKMPTEEDFQRDEKALENFFTGLVDTAVQRAQEASQRQSVIKEAETNAWNDVFAKYPEIKESKQLRDTIHNIRIGAYQRGQSMSPTEVADQLIGELHREYKKGVNDTNVQTTVRSSQPIGGGSRQQPSVGVDFAKLQDGGRNAAVSELEKLMSQGLI